MSLNRYIFSVLLSLTFVSQVIAKNNILDQLPNQSSVLKGYEYTDVITRLSQAPLHDIEGIWQFVDNATTIVIEQFNPDEIAGEQLHLYRIVIIDSNRLSIEPGTIMGYASVTTKENCFDARIFSDGKLNGILSIPKTLTLNLSTDASRLTFNEYKKEIKINLWRLIPYIYRVGVSFNDTRPKGLDGCIKIYPKSTSAPISPRYL